MGLRTFLPAASLLGALLLIVVGVVILNASLPPPRGTASVLDYLGTAVLAAIALLGAGYVAALGRRDWRLALLGLLLAANAAAFIIAFNIALAAIVNGFYFPDAQGRAVARRQWDMFSAVVIAWGIANLVAAAALVWRFWWQKREVGRDD
jgi:hypothetical protein